MACPISQSPTSAGDFWNTVVETHIESYSTPKLSSDLAWQLICVLDPIQEYADYVSRLAGLGPTSGDMEKAISGLAYLGINMDGFETWAKLKRLLNTRAFRNRKVDEPIEAHIWIIDNFIDSIQFPQLVSVALVSHHSLMYHEVNLILDENIEGRRRCSCMPPRPICLSTL